METERLIIRSFHESEAIDLFEYLSDAQVVLFEPYEVMNREDYERSDPSKSRRKLLRRLSKGDGEVNWKSLFSSE